MKIFTKNEYSTLKSVLLGSVDMFAWPTDDDAFNNSIRQSDFAQHFDYSIGKNVLQEATDDLNRLHEVLDTNGVKVIRPAHKKSNWSFSARDVLLTYQDKIIQCPTPYISRRQEYTCYDELRDVDVMKIPYPKDPADPMFDAANVCKFDDTLLFLESYTGNKAGASLLVNIFDTEVVTWQDVYAFAHIDSTLISLNHNTIMLNAKRVSSDKVPLFLKSKKIIWVDQVVHRKYDKFPFASPWIGMNVLSINPETVIVDEIQTKLIQQLEENKFKVIRLPMRQSRTLGGGFHCVTCDLERACE